MSNGKEYYFYLWIEYLQLYRQWMKWWEDLVDLFWYKNKEED